MRIQKPSKCCHPDCEKCPYADCEWDGLDSDEIQDKSIDVLLFPVSREVKMARDRANRYAKAHRDKVRETTRLHRLAHKEEYNARSREWNHRNKDRVAANKRKLRANNPEYYRQKQRDYKARVEADDPGHYARLQREYRAKRKMTKEQTEASYG